MKTIKIKNLQTSEIQELNDSELSGILGGGLSSDIGASILGGGGIGASILAKLESTKRLNRGRDKTLDLG